VALTAVAQLAVAMGVVLSGCGSGIDGKNTITERQAYDKVEDYIRQAMTALPVEARVEAQSPADSLTCEKHGGDGGPVSVGVAYWVRGITSEDRYFDAILEWWEAHGFVVRDDSRPESNRISVDNPKDGFAMVFRENRRGELLLIADSPCVWPNGTPAPE
jgi:hypothetical protein